MMEASHILRDDVGTAIVIRFSISYLTATSKSRVEGLRISGFGFST